MEMHPKGKRRIMIAIIHVTHINHTASGLKGFTVWLHVLFSLLLTVFLHSLKDLLMLEDSLQVMYLYVLTSLILLLTLLD